MTTNLWAKDLLNVWLLPVYIINIPFHDQSSPFGINVLRVIPILTHYSDIVSDIPSGCIYNIWHIYSDILSDILSGIYSDILSGSLSGMLSGIYSDILSGIFSCIHSGSLSGIYSHILSGIYFVIFSWFSCTYYVLTFCLALWHSLCHVFGSRRGQHPELAIKTSGPKPAGTRGKEWSVKTLTWQVGKKTTSRPGLISVDADSQAALDLPKTLDCLQLARKLRFQVQCLLAENRTHHRLTTVPLI